MEKRFSKRNWLAGLAAGAVSVLASNRYLYWDRQLSSSTVLLVWLAVLGFAGALFFAQKERRLQGYALFFGLCFAAAQVCGTRLEETQTLALNWQEVLLMLVCIAASAPAAGGLFTGLVRLAQRQSRRDAHRMSERKVFWISAGVLLLCWLPYLAAFYPGLFTYDVSYQFMQYNNGELNTHHPLLHTLLVGGFYDLGWYLFGYPVRGILMYALFQMALLALVMASAVACLHRCHAPRWTCALTLVCGAALPFNTLLSISTTKDTLFAASVLWLTVLAFEAFHSPERVRSKGWNARFLLAIMCTGLMRNNGFICIAGAALAGLAALMRKPALGRRVIALCLCGAVAYTSINWGLKAATRAADGPAGEMFSVPAQQLARVYVMTDDEAKEEIKAFLPTAENYAPSISDHVKNTFKPHEVSMPAFLKLWAEVGLRHPVIYLEAIAETTRGFWHLDATPAGQYLETTFHTDEANWLVEDSMWPQLRDTMNRLYSHNEYQDIPLYSVILPPAFWCWALVWIMTAGLYLRRKAAVCAGTAVSALYLSTLLGPCVMFRYIYPVAICVPFLLGALLIPPEEA